jgi:lysophospholipase L1-like esterase
MKHFLFLCLTGALSAAPLKFQLGDGPPVVGFTQVKTDYDDDSGNGLLPGATADVRTFALKVEEGNYEVTLRLGHGEKATKTTVYAESRRMMVRERETAAGKFEEVTLLVNVRKPKIAGGETTKLKEREAGPPPVPDWDELLTLEFVGRDAGDVLISVQPAKTDVVTVFLAGDSTVNDQPWGPFFGWGQMLPLFFQSSAAVSNHAESGLALHSFEGGRRLKKVQSMMQPGDYLFIQFGHNDQKDKSRGAGPFTSYKANLKRFIAAAREKGGLPVLVTPMERRRWVDGRPGQTLTDFAEAVRQVGKEDAVAVIDLHAASLALYAALGEQGSKLAFVHHPANTFPSHKEALRDDTHHSAYGGYQLARCMAEAIRTQLPDLAQHLVARLPAFDPTRPEAFESVSLPWNLATCRPGKPDGN